MCRMPPALVANSRLSAFLDAWHDREYDTLTGSKMCLHAPIAERRLSHT